MSHHRTLTINLARIILAAGVALPASFGTSLAAEQFSLAAAQSSPEDITLTTPRTTRGLFHPKGKAPESSLRRLVARRLPGPGACRLKSTERGLV